MKTKTDENYLRLSHNCHSNHSDYADIAAVSVVVLELEDFSDVSLFISHVQQLMSDSKRNCAKV